MPSISHVAIGFAASRFNRKNSPTVWTPFGAAVVWSTISLLPDLDVVGSRFGIRYEDTWGHRGVTHSFAFAVVVALAVYLFGRLAKFRAVKMALIALAVVASHAMLDTFTDGGYGCALLWPFSDKRIFAPWTPIPVAPMGLAFLSAEGLRVAGVEIILSLPVLAYAFWPSGNRQKSR
jgi:inner membrane protein